MKSNFYLLSTFLFLFQFQVLGQVTDSSVAFVASWQKGDVRKYKITKSKTELRDGKSHKSETNSYIASFTVLATNKNSSTIEYQYENQLFSNTTELPAEVKQVATRHKLQRVKYTTDEYGAFKGVENWREISNLTKDIFEQVIRSTPNQNKENLQKAMKPLIEAYSSKEGIEGLILKELQYFHSPYGGVFSIHDTITYKETLPNLFGGAPISGNGKVYFINQEKQDNTCKMINELALNEKDALKMVEELFTKMMVKLDYKTEEEKNQKKVEMQKAMQAMKMDIKDYNVYIYDKQENWPVSLNYKRTSIVNTPQNKGERIDETTIELLKE